MDIENYEDWKHEQAYNEGRNIKKQGTSAKKDDIAQKGNNMI